MMKYSRSFYIILALSVIWVGIFLFGSYLAPYDPSVTNVSERLQDVSTNHWLGTDQLGRDVLSRILWGGQDSIFIAFTIVIVSGLIGIILGGLFKVGPRWLGEIGGRIIDMMLGFPNIIIAIALIGVLGPSMENTMIALIITKWAEYAQITRNLMDLEMKSPYVAYARMSGASRGRIMYKYMVPNMISPLLTVMIQHIGEMIIIVASFSLIGIGVQPPTPEWGAILLSSQDFLQTAPWLLMYPGLAIFITVVLFNFISDEISEQRRV